MRFKKVIIHVAINLNKKIKNNYPYKLQLSLAFR